MSTEGVRNAVHLFEECHMRIQTLGEILLISCKPRPVFTVVQDLELTNENFVRYRDKVISHLNKMCILSKDISSQLHTERLQVEKHLHQPLTSLSATMVTLTQLSAHIAYLMAINGEGSEPATQGPVSSHFELVQADLELKFVCARLKRSHGHDFNPHALVELCSIITKSLSCIADICKEAADRISDSHEQDQFKLCVKSITSTTGCLVSSVKSLKSRRQHHHSSSSSHTRDVLDASHLQRVVNFCLPVTTTSTALTAFATEDKFLGSPASLSPLGENIYKSVLGLCMSMVSATVQIIKAARDLLHDPTKRKHKDRISLCVESISRTAFRLRDFLLSYDFAAANPTASPATSTSASTTDRGDDKHLTVIKEGEISTPFHATRKKKKNKNEEEEEGEEEKQEKKKEEEEDGEYEKTLTKRDRHKHNNESSLDRKHQTSSLLSPSASSSSSLVVDRLGAVHTSSNSPSANKLSTSSPISSPKLSSKTSSSSDSKKRHHRKSSSSSRHSSSNSGPIESQSPQHNISASSCVSSSMSNETVPPSPHPTTLSPLLLPQSSAGAAAPSSLSLPPSSSSPPTPSSSSLLPPQPSTSSLSSSSTSSSSSPQTTVEYIQSSSSSNSSESLDASVRNMKQEFVLPIDVLDGTKSERL